MKEQQIAELRHQKGVMEEAPSQLGREGEGILQGRRAFLAEDILDPDSLHQS